MWFFDKTEQKCKQNTIYRIIVTFIRYFAYISVISIDNLSFTRQIKHFRRQIFVNLQDRLSHEESLSDVFQRGSDVIYVSVLWVNMALDQSERENLLECCKKHIGLVP